MSYRISTIVERTGIPAMTLRSWERRYGFPVPTRTTSGYRTYSDDDLRQVLAVKRMIDDGASVSDAVDQVRKRPKQSEPEALVEALFVAAQALAERDVQRIVSQAVETLSPREFCHRFALPAFWRASQDLDIATEHLVSAVLRTHLRNVIESVQPAPTGRPVVLACPENEEHEGGLLAVALELRLLGQRAIVLGANTPSEALGAAAKKADARAICLSLVGERSKEQIKRTIKSAVAVAGKTPVIVGGATARKHLKLVYECGASYAGDAAELLSLIA